MNRNSIFKTLFATLLLVLACMLYWSSLLQEEQLKDMRKEIGQIRAEMIGLRQKVVRNNPEVLSKPTQYMSDHYPNLLETDDYLVKTLPALLPEGFLPKGILKKATIGRPENLHPFSGFRDISQMIDMCTGSAADLKTGHYETLAPKLALKIEERSSSENPEQIEYWVHLRDDIYWEPLNPDHFPTTMHLSSHFLKRHRVTAHDFKFFYDAIMNPYVHEAKAVSLRSYYQDITHFECLSDSCFIVRWKAYPVTDPEGNEHKRVKYTSRSLTGGLQPLARFVFQYFADGEKIIEEDSDKDSYKINSVWAQNFAHHWAKNVIVSCGPYMFDGMTEEGILLRRNPNYYDPYAVLIEGMSYAFKEGTDAIWQDFKSGKIDLCILAPNQLLELEDFLRSPAYRQQELPIHHLDYVDLSYYYIGWNNSSPFFANPKVRKAMTLAIDRRRIIEQNLNMMGIPITGPFFRYSPAYDETIAELPFDPDEAGRLLEEAGWIDNDGDGIRDQIVEGVVKPFHFKLYYYVKSLSTKVVAEYIVTALHSVGIRAELHGIDLADLSRTFEDKSFDALLMGWKLGTPPEDPRQLWHSSGAHEKGSSNMIGFANSEIDTLIEQLSYEYDSQTRADCYHRFHHIIHELVPYTFLYTPKLRILYRDTVQNLFIPRERSDLIPHADVPEPYLYSVWLKTAEAH